MAKNKTEKIIIELDFDTTDFTKSAAKLNGEIADLNKQQRELKKNGQENSITYQKNSEALRENKKELASANKAIQNINTARKAESGSMEQQKAQLSVLTQEYNALSKEQRESGVRGQELNSQINHLTDSLKGSEEEIGNNRRSVGDYGKALEGTPFGSFISGIQGMGKAFIANPLGLIITAIAAALALLTKAFTKSEAGSNRVKRATSAVSAVFSAFLKVLEPVAEFIADALSAAFDELAKQIDLAAEGLQVLLDLFDFGDASAALGAFVQETKDAVKLGQDLADAEAELVRVRREQMTVQLEAQNAAEKQRQIRDDESKSIAERKAANEELGRILEEQSAKELAMAQKAMDVALLRQKVDGDTTEVLDELAEAKRELIDIEERITGQQSEQLVNINSLNRDAAQQAKDAAAAAKQRAADAIAVNRQELELYTKQQGVRKKGMQEQLEQAQTVADREVEILKDELDKKLITQLEYDIALADIQNELALKQAEVAVENAQTELDAIVQLNESKIQEGQFLNDELFMQEQERLNKQLEAQLEFEALRLEQGVISQQEYNDAINTVNEENEQAVADLEAEKKEADKERDLVDLENQREIDILNREDEFELLRQDLERNKQAELENAEATGADKSLIEDKYAKFSKKIDKDQRKAQVSEALGAFNAVAGLAAGNAEAEKAIAIASSIINGYQGVTAVLAAKSTIPEPFGSVVKGISAAAIGASALLNVNKIRSTPVPSKKAARGAGFFGGEPHSRGGTKGVFSDGTNIEVEKDEAFFVVNKRSSAFIDRLNGLNQMNGYGDDFFGRGGQKTFLQDGGIGLDAVSSSVQDEQASVSAAVDAVSALPAPVVVVQDINQAQGDELEVISRAEV